MTEAKKEQGAFFACGGTACPKGGVHEWSKDLKPVPGMTNTESVYCLKCGLNKLMTIDMWS